MARPNRRASKVETLDSRSRGERTT